MLHIILLILGIINALTYNLFLSFFFIMFHNNHISQKGKERIENMAVETTQIQLQAIFNNSNLAIFTVDAKARFITFNPVFFKKSSQIFNKAPQNGEAIWNYFPENIHQTFYAAIEYCLQEANTIFELELEAYNQKKCCFEISASPLKYAEKVIGILFIIKDITQQKEAELRMKETEFLLQSISNNIHEGIFRSTPEKGLVYVNEAFIRLFNYQSVEEILPIPPAKFYASKEDRRHLAEKLARKGYYKNEEILFKRKDGTTFWGKITVTLYKNEKQEIFYDGVVSDITERKEQKERLLESEKLLKSVNQNIKDAIYRIHQKKGLIYVNTAFKNMFGYKEESSLSCISKSCIYKFRKDLKLLKKSGKNVKGFKNQEIKFKRQDGSSFWGLVNVSISKDEEDFYVYDGAIHDITERKEFEESLKKSEESLRQQKEELEIINSELDNFVYITSHDLKAPLASILGLVNVMRLENDNTLKDNIYLNMIEQSIFKLDNFTSDIIDYSKNSRLKVNSQKIIIPKLSQGVWEDLTILEQNAIAAPQVLIENEQNIPFHSDKKRLKVIFRNLLSNALRYYDREKNSLQIAIKVKVFKEKALLSFSDNGEGIEEKYLPKIFEMFYRASAKSKGAGLGLYIVKQIVKTLDGKIAVSSIPKVGTTFKITLPNLFKQ